MNIEKNNSYSSYIKKFTRALSYDVDVPQLQ